MAVNLESHGLPVGIAYGAPVTVQDQQGQGHGQQPAQDAGYGNTSAFERATPGASLPHVEDMDQEAAGGGDLLSKLSGFIRAVGEVVVQLGEYIRDAGGALADGLAGEQAPVQAPAAQAQTPAQAPALGTPAGAPMPTAPGAPQVLAAPAQQLATAAVQPSQPRQTSPSLGARPSEPTSRDAAKVSAAGVGEAASTPSATTAGPRGGGRASQSSGYPVLNPLPPYLGDQLAFFDYGAPSEPQAQLPEFHGPIASLSASARPPVQPTYSVEQAVAVEAAQGAAEIEPANNVIPFPGPAARDALHGEASNEATGEALQPEADPSSPRYSAVVFRPAFYGNLRC